MNNYSCCLLFYVVSKKYLIFIFWFILIFCTYFLFIDKCLIMCKKIMF